MEEIERVNAVSQLLINCDEVIKMLDEMYYKKGYEHIDKYISIEKADIEFRECRKLLIKNNSRLLEQLQTNKCLHLALQIQLKLLANEIENIAQEDEGLVSDSIKSLNLSSNE
tara:strand:- start:4794 stop:5132 length:339 start_codon:yes stop_codon:yes gene_type:complete